MKLRSNGYEVTEIPGLERIEINAVEADEETYVEIILVDRNGVTSSFDRAGFSEFVTGLHQATRLATLLADQIADGNV